MTNMKNPNLRMKNIQDYKFTKGFPTRENCDLDDPREMFVWMFVALPGVNGGPQMLPTPYWMMVSEHLWELGARLVEDPVKKYRTPSASDPNRFTAPGQWVPIETPDPDPNPARTFVRALPTYRIAEVKREIEALENDPDDAA